MRLEYRLHLFTPGRVRVTVHLAPTQRFRPDHGLRYGMSFDEAAPQLVDAHADGSLAAWEREVADGVKVLTTEHGVASAGPHGLRYWAVDPGLVLQKLVVDAGGARDSYLGPSESAWRRGR